ncbi:hypothetical protein MJO29_010725 [Puccinia striiformis f. sp. tritici]|nr:hypothetical protein MJO29_010725 [Puccinia striiformis f. sp. tritici]
MHITNLLTCIHHLPSPFETMLDCLLLGDKPIQSANGGSDDDAHDEDTYDLPTNAILGEEIAPKDNNKEHLSFTQDLVVSSHPLLKQDHQPERV